MATAASPRVVFHLIPHTHWDREWYLTRTAFQVRLVPVIENLLTQVEHDRSARFVLDGQTVILEDCLEIRPDLSDRLVAAVRRGAIEIGPWYIQPDELIPSGESLLRNLLEGKQDGIRFGGRMNVLHCPDAFGHPTVLPALAAEFGIRAAVAWRGVGRPFGEDRDLYRWGEGPSVLLYHLPREGYSVAAELVYPGRRLEQIWRHLRPELEGRATTDQIAVFVGADHHAAPTAFTGLRDQLQQLESNHEVRLSGLGEYFEAQGRSAGRPGEITGELRRIDDHTWVLQGVHSTRSRLKRLHSLAELNLTRIIEPLTALADLQSGRDRRGELRLAWRTLLQSQFHDTLGGCTCDDVAREQEVRLHSVADLNRELASSSLRILSGYDPDLARDSPDGKSPRLLLWNPCARSRSAITTAEVTFFRSDILVGPPDGRRPRHSTPPGSFVLQTRTGDLLPVQVLSTRPGQERLDADRHYPDQDWVDRVSVAFSPPRVEGMGLISLGLRTAPPRARQRAGVMGTSTRLTNPYLMVRVTPLGEITVRDRQTGQTYLGLLALEDEPEQGDTYTRSRGPGPVTRRGRPRSREILAAGSLVGALETRWSMPAATGGILQVRQVAVLHADSRLLRLRLDVENGASDHRLRLQFPVQAGETARAGAAFRTEQRPAGVEQPRRGIEIQTGTHPAHRFVAAASGSRGLAIFAPGFFEYQWTRDRRLMLTLLRSVGELSRGDLRERPGHAGWPQSTPLAQEPGSHTISLAIAPVTEDDLNHPDRLERLWEDAFLPLQSVFYRDYAGQQPPTLAAEGGITLEGEGLVLSAVKPAESGSGLVLRCYNATGAVTSGRWRFGRSLARATRLRADESEVEPMRLSSDRLSVPLKAEPHQILTVLIIPGE
jgi:mannosylglycerate hydrolase